MGLIPYVCVSGFAAPAELAAIDRAWPGPDWGQWHAYGPGQGNKLASTPASAIGGACANLLYRMAASDLGDLLGLGGVVPDLGLYGAGLHEMPAGSPGLPAHRDASHHALLGLPRALSAVLYVHQGWASSWGGHLEFYGDDPRGPVLDRLVPTPGLLVVFAPGEIGWHGVSAIRGQRPRRSLTLFGLGAPDGQPVLRSQAQFDE